MRCPKYDLHQQKQMFRLAFKWSVILYNKFLYIFLQNEMKNKKLSLKLNSSFVEYFIQIFP